MEEMIRKIVRRHSNLGEIIDTIDASANLFDYGLTSFSTVQIMMAVEEKLEIEFPDDLINKQSFESIAAIARNVQSISPQ